MKAYLTIPLLAASAFGQITVYEETDNECWFNEGGTWLGTCRDIFYWYCDEYEVNPGEACNVRTFSNTMLEWNYEDLAAIYFAYGVDDAWLDTNADTTTTDTSSLLRDLGDLPQIVFQSLLAIPDPRPTTHERYDDWVDPFSEGCVDITLSDNGIVYDTDEFPKLTYLRGMCGFRITFTNQNTISALNFKVKRDGASNLVASAIALTAVAASTLF